MREVEVYRPIVSFLDSNTTVHFTTELATNAGESEDLDGLKCNGIIINTVILQSKQNLSWDLYFFRTSGQEDTDLDLDTFIEKVEFNAVYGKQIAGSGQYYYNWASLSIPYRDDNIKCQLHCKLVNRSATSKTAGVNGAVKLTIVYEPDGSKPGGV